MRTQPNPPGSTLPAFRSINALLAAGFQDEDGGKGRKKQKTDKKDKKRKDGSSRRDKRGAAGDDEGAAAAAAAGDGDGEYRAEELFGEDDENENEDAAVETEADKAFIDDDGVCKRCLQLLLPAAAALQLQSRQHMN